MGNMSAFIGHSIQIDSQREKSFIYYDLMDLMAKPNALLGNENGSFVYSCND